MMYSYYNAYNTTTSSVNINTVHLFQIPKKASLKFNLNTRTGKPNAYPYIVLENVYVFPGSPVFFERSFQGLYEVISRELFSAIFFSDWSVSPCALRVAGFVLYNEQEICKRWGIHKCQGRSVYECLINGSKRIRQCFLWFLPSE